MQSLDQGALFLVTVVFNLYLWVLMIRAILFYQGANYFNPITHFVIRITNVFIKPLKKVTPNKGGVEIATLIIIAITELVKTGLLFALLGVMPNALVITLQFVGDLIRQLLNLYFYLIIIIAIASWLGSAQQNPAIELLERITDPVLRPVRKLIPLIGGIDVSPLVVLIVIKLIEIVVVTPLLPLRLM